MNLLSMVMGLLLIFACTFTLSLRKATMSQNVEKTYQAHVNASRKILNSYESICYQRMREEKKEPKNETKNVQREKHVQALNRDCARLNLWPLLQDGKQNHLVLYETAAQLLRTFYGEQLFAKQPRLEYRLLDAILDAAQSASHDANLTYLSLEKLALKESNVKQLYPLQLLYYRMLKGTKQQMGGQNYPTMLDYFALEKKDSHICLQHASADMLRALFGEKAAPVIYHELQESKIPLLPERVREICSQNGLISLNDDFLKLLDLNSCHRSSGQKTLVQQDADVCLKQKVFLPS